MKIISNQAEIMARVEQAFAKTADAYGAEIQQVIREPRDWGDGFGTTYRRNGEVVVGGFRNIVDEANLAGSQTLDVNGLTATYTWDGNGITPAAIVHEGAVLSNGTIIPARRFTEVAANQMNFGAVFVDAYQNGT